MGKSPAMGGPVEPDQVDQLVDPAGDGGGVLAEQPGGDPDILGHGHVREQADALKDIANPAAQHDRVDGPDILAGDLDRTLARVDQPVNQAQQRGLAGAGWADDGQELPFSDRKRHAVDHLAAAVAVALADRIEGNCCGCGRLGGHRSGHRLAGALK